VLSAPRFNFGLYSRQRADEKRRKQEEKEARRLRELHSRDHSDYELQLARERDAQSTTRDRPKSLIGPTGGIAFPQTGTTTYNNTSTGYPPSPFGHGYGSLSAYGSSGHSRSASSGTFDVKHVKGERERKVSIGGTHVYGSRDASPYERPRTISGSLSDRSNQYPPHSNTYTPGSGTYGSSKSQYSSPNVRPSDFAYGIAGSTGYPASNLSSSPSLSGYGPPGGYPPSHILYDPNTTNQPRTRAPSRAASRAASRAVSRAPSPNPGSYRSCYSRHVIDHPIGFISRSSSPFGKSPYIPVSTIPGEPQQLPAPEAFSRPINAANTFSPFDPVKVLDMDEIYDTRKLPRMPSLLLTHDIRPDDWKRCMQVVYFLLTLTYLLMSRLTRIWHALGLDNYLWQLNQVAVIPKSPSSPKI